MKPRRSWICRSGHQSGYGPIAAAQACVCIELALDAAVVAAYGLDPATGDAGCAQTLGCLNIHASRPATLARRRPNTGSDYGRGRRDRHHDHANGSRSRHWPHAAPAQNMPITPRTTTAAILHDRARGHGRRTLILDALALPPQPVNCSAGSWTPPTRRSSSRQDPASIDWTMQSPRSIDRQIRAFDPWPGSIYISWVGSL